MFPSQQFSYTNMSKMSDLLMEYLGRKGKITLIFTS
jgi:hypothetical protein